MNGSRVSVDRTTNGADSLGRLLSELVHDLANEVTVLQGWAQLARGEVEAGRLPSAEMERVVELSDSMGAMLRDLLIVAAGKPSSPEVDFDPRAVTEAVVARRVREFSSVTVRLRTTVPEDVRVRGFASFWGRVVANLLNNAARFARSEILVELELDAGDLLLRIEDDGRGVPEELRERIFDPFWSGDRERSGLGLSSVEWLVGWLGGGARYVDARRLGGAGLEVRVPMQPRRGGAEPGPVVRDALRGMRLVIIDDDREVSRALARLLERVGAEVRELDPVGEPEEAILESLVSSVPDGILMDLRLGGRGGVALWRRMREEIPALASRTIFMSGAAPGDPEWEEAVTAPQPLLAKPFTLEQVAEAVERVA